VAFFPRRILLGHSRAALQCRVYDDEELIAMRRLTGWLILVGMISAAASGANSVHGAENTFRVATYNTSLFRNEDGTLVKDLEGGENEQARKIAEVIQRVRPDVLFLNEFDYDADGNAAALFLGKYVGVGQNGRE